jgi:regulatory protein
VALGRLPGLSLKGRALRYLAQREHSRAELGRKLARFAEDTPQATATDQIGRVLDELQALDLLSDTRAAASVLASQGARHGVYRLRHTLQQRGLAPDLVAQTLDLARSSEFDRALAVWRRKFGAPADDAASRARQARFLSARGFDADVVRRIVRGLTADD